MCSGSIGDDELVRVGEEINRKDEMIGDLLNDV